MPRNQNQQVQQSLTSISECVDSIYEEFQWAKEQLKSVEAKEHAALAMSKVEIIEDIANKVFGTLKVEQQTEQQKETEQQNNTGRSASYRGRRKETALQN